MAVYRVEKTKDFTVMANYHLKDRTISLKAKGLLSVMLSLPENWVYTLKGLASISKEGLDAIREGIRELEAAGYIIRNRTRNEKGQLAGAEYIIREQPQPVAEKQARTDAEPSEPLPNPPQAEPLEQAPTTETPAKANPITTAPIWKKPAPENPTQSVPMLLRTKEVKTDLENIHKSIYPSNPDGMDVDRCRREVRTRIDYYGLLEDPSAPEEQLDEIVELTVETLCSSRPTIQIAGDEYPAKLVKERFLKLTGKHIGYVMDRLKANRTLIRNIKNYLLAVLFNAAVTVDHYYTAEFNHFYLGGGAVRAARA